MVLLTKKFVQSSSALFKPKNCSFLSTKANETFRFEDLEINIKKTNPNLPDDPCKIVFGTKFSDHMFSAEWDSKTGWSKPKIGPFQNISLHPASKVLHYAVETFEGLKAYKGVDGKIRLFRPDLNIGRLHKSSLRSVLPGFDQNEFLKCLKKLISIDKDWIPKSTEASLYIRPTFIGTEGALGVSVSNKALLYVFTSPTGPYFTSGFKPITLLAETRYVRAFPGGVGNYKVGSNYGPTIFVNVEAQKKGAHHVLWLLGKEELLTEAGIMNILLVVKNSNGEVELITPPLNGTILEGITRLSILDLARQSGIKVSEREITMAETLDLIKSNRLLEAFGTGTACLVCPIEAILYRDQKYDIPTMKNGSYYMKNFLEQLKAIHYGIKPHEWAPLVE